MPTREEMRSLAEDIVGTYEERIATITELRGTVQLDRRELRTHLEELRDSRVAITREVRADLAKGVADRKREVGGMLNGFGQALAIMGKEMRADLAKGVADRKREVGGMLNGFNAELKELKSARTAMSQELKADLAKGVADRKREVGGMLTGFGQALAIMGKEMRADLAKGVADRKQEVSIIKSDVGILLRGFSAELKALRSELAGGRDEWRKMTATMQSKRGGVTVAVKPAIEEAEEEAAAEITPELANIRDRVFEYLANHPDGTKMTELEQEFGLARIQMARIIRSLMDENKVNKQDLLYFAI